MGKSTPSSESQAPQDDHALNTALWAMGDFMIVTAVILALIAGHSQVGT
jgi:hypothetical protein